MFAVCFLFVSCLSPVLLVVYCYIYNMATKHTIDEDLVLSGDSTVNPWNMKVIVALMNIQALSHLDQQGIAVIPVVCLLKVLVMRRKLK